MRGEYVPRMLRGRQETVGDARVFLGIWRQHGRNIKAAIGQFVY
jgi:hypothetical protein